MNTINKFNACLSISHHERWVVPNSLEFKNAQGTMTIKRKPVPITAFARAQVIENISENILK